MSAAPSASPVLTDMLASQGSPRDLTPPQVTQLRAFYEDRDFGLWHFARDVFGFRDLKPEIHLPICRLLGRWGETHLRDGTILTRPPTDLDHRETARSYRRIMVGIPREWFKSSLGTRANALWTIARNPNATIGVFNEKEENVESWIGSICEVVEGSVLFQVLWRNLIPRGIGFWDKEKGVGPSRRHKWGASGALFERSTTGVSELSLEPHGVGSATAGKHFTHTILDDIIGLKAQQSEAVMEAAKEWMDKKRALERPAENGCELLNYTTWSYNDVYKHIVEQWPGEYLQHNRALLENPATGEPDDVEGVSAFPEKIGTEKAYRMKAADPFTFSAQYMLQPRAGKHQSFQEEWLGSFTVVQSGSERYLRIDDACYDPRICEWESGEDEAPQVVGLHELERATLLDPAPSKSTEVRSDPHSRNAIVSVGIDPYGRLFVLEAEPSREGPTEVLKRVIAHYTQWATRRIAIEEVIFSAVYRPLWMRILELDPQYQNVRPEWMTLSPRSRDKDQRIRDNLIPLMENRRVYLRTSGTGYLRKEILEFPYGQTKDLLDALAYAPEAVSRPYSSFEQDSASRRNRARRTERGVTGYGF